MSSALGRGSNGLTGYPDGLPGRRVWHIGVLRGGDDQLTAKLILELNEGRAICPRCAGGDGHLVGENLDERIWDGLVGAGVTDVDLQGHLWREEKATKKNHYYPAHLDHNSAVAARTGAGGVCEANLEPHAEWESLEPENIFLLGILFYFT